VGFAAGVLVLENSPCVNEEFIWPTLLGEIYGACDLEPFHGRRSHVAGGIDLTTIARQGVREDFLRVRGGRRIGREVRLPRCEGVC
jgi:hypothetical protein